MKKNKWRNCCWAETWSSAHFCS